LELESEIIAKEEAQRGLKELTPDCDILLQTVEKEIGLKLADPAPADWKGWLTYRRGKDKVVILRGRAFKEPGMFGKHRAGLDVAYGADTITEYKRGFDVSPPQDLDHLLVNFGCGDSVRVFLWYGENVAAYRLIFEQEMHEDPDEELKEAVAEACHWIVKKPKDLTLPEFLAKQGN
jgi:hypothetical protein